MGKLLPWGVGIATVLGLLFFATSSEAATGPAVAPPAVTSALGRALYEEGKASGQTLVVYASATPDPVAEPYTALGWVRAQVKAGRAVFCTTSVLDEIELSSAPLYSFPEDKIPSYVSKSSTFMRVVVG